MFVASLKPCPDAYAAGTGPMRGGGRTGAGNMDGAFGTNGGGFGCPAIPDIMNVVLGGAFPSNGGFFAGGREPCRFTKAVDATAGGREP